MLVRVASTRECREAAEMQTGPDFFLPGCMALAHPFAFLTFSFLIYKMEEVKPGDLRYFLSFRICDSQIPSPVFLCTRAVEQVS